MLAAAVALLVGLPWLAPGYIFATDFPGPRHLPFPSTLTSSAPLEAVLATCGLLVGAAPTERILLFGCFFIAVLGAYRAVPTGHLVPRVTAALVFGLNPFVYGRLLYGQFYLVAAYALLPWVACALRALVVEPRLFRACRFGVMVGVLGLLDLHLLLPAAVLTGSALAVFVIAGGTDRRGLARAVGVAGAITLLINAFWLVPLLAGSGPQAALVRQVDETQLRAFAVVPDPQLGLWPNLLGLYGFWAEATHRFASMKELTAAWPAVLVFILALAAIGIARRREPAEPRFRYWQWTLVVAALVALVLEAGISDPMTAPMGRALDNYLPLYRGMRDTGKWAVLPALALALLAGDGATRLVSATGRLRSTRWREPALAILLAALVALPLYYGNGLLFGARQQLQPTEYPAGWYQADHLGSSRGPGTRAVFLPWHQYQSYGFVRGANHVLASPAPAFFSFPVVAQDLTMTDSTAPARRAQAGVTRLVSAGATGDWANVLRGNGIDLVIVARETDWASYAYLDSLPNIRRLADYGSVIVYEVS